VRCIERLNVRAVGRDSFPNYHAISGKTNAIHEQRSRCQLQALLASHWFVAQQDVPIDEGMGLYQPKGQLLCDAFKHRPAFAKDNWNDNNLILID
jgi:hypothetical protein